MEEGITNVSADEIERKIGEAVQAMFGNNANDDEIYFEAKMSMLQILSILSVTRQLVTMNDNLLMLRNASRENSDHIHSLVVVMKGILLTMTSQNITISSLNLDKIDTNG